MCPLLPFSPIYVSLYFLQVADRMFDNGSWTGRLFGKLWLRFQPATTLKRTAARRLSVHADDELWGFSYDDLAALEALLGGHDFFFGARASALDCAVFGQLVQFVDIPMSFPQQARHVESAVL